MFYFIFTKKNYMNMIKKKVKIMKIKFLNFKLSLNNKSKSFKLLNHIYEIIEWFQNNRMEVIKLLILVLRSAT